MLARACRASFYHLQQLVLLLRPAKVMKILENGLLTEEFLRGCALPNLRQVLADVLGSSAPKSNSRLALLTKLDEHQIEMTSQQLADVLWRLFDERLEGGYHVMILSATDLQDKVSRGELDTGLESLRRQIREDGNVVTGEPLTVRLLDGTHPEVQVLYLSETTSTFRAREEDREEPTILGTRITKVSYEAAVPIISKIHIAIQAGTVRIFMRPVRQGGHPAKELPPIRNWVENRLDVTLPPWGIRDGIKKLKKAGRLVWKDVNLSESNADAKASYKPPVSRTISNAICDAAEASLDGFDLDHGTLFFDDVIPFRVDCGNAVFSFGANTHPQDAEHVIQTVRQYSV